MELVDEILNALRPTNAAGDLIGESASDHFRFANGFRIDIADNGDAGCSHFCFLQRDAECLVGGFHQA